MGLNSSRFLTRARCGPHVDGQYALHGEHVEEEGPEGTISSIQNAMYIHPATAEVVQRATYSLRRAGHVHAHDHR